jgi:hypothetical protein
MNIIPGVDNFTIPVECLMMPARTSGLVTRKSPPAFTFPGMYELEHTVQCTYDKSRKLLQPR